MQLLSLNYRMLHRYGLVITAEQFNGHAKNLYDADELFELRDQQFFKFVCRPNHCHYHL